MTDRAWRQMHDWPLVRARRPGFMDEPEVMREREAEEHDWICTEWEYAAKWDASETEEAA